MSLLEALTTITIIFPHHSNNIFNRGKRKYPIACLISFLGTFYIIFLTLYKRLVSSDTVPY